MVNVGIVGGTGYSGVELIRLLSSHPQVNIEVVTSRANSGKPVAETFPNLRDMPKLCFSDPVTESYQNCELVFFATPNTTAMIVPARRFFTSSSSAMAWLTNSLGR